MRAEWTQLLMLPGLGSDLSASITRRPGKLANDPEDQTQLAGQTLLSLANLYRHEKAFRVLLDWGIDPTCPAVCEIRKKKSTFVQKGHSMSRQEPLDQKRESNNHKMSDEAQTRTICMGCLY